jgi:hypothetical protein
MFSTKRIVVNLGHRLWKTSGPAYGLGSRIDGAVKVNDTKHRLASITVTLEGRLKSSVPEKLPTGDEQSSAFLSHMMSIYDASKDGDFNAPAEIPFSFPFPTHLRYKGEERPCPPSFSYADVHFICEISYSLRFDVSWNSNLSKKLKKSESKAISIYYLPKTSPTIPPLCILPPASRHLENPPLFLQGSERMDSFPIAPAFRPTDRPIKLTKQQRLHLKSLENSVYLSLPVPAIFTSGQQIPFMISLSFPDNPYISEMLSCRPEVQLLKQVGLNRKADGVIGSTIERNIPLSTATIRKSSGWCEGVVVLKGEIQAGDAGTESSWLLSDVAHVQYILRVSLKPPRSLSEHVPSFVSDTVIKLTTSSWGSVEREMASSGGSTTPAVNLASNLRRLY